MLKRSLLLGSVLALSSCSYVLDRQIQDVTLVTPGAEDTVCYMYVDGLRYKVYPPQTVNISKSHEDLVVDCIAPQNRRRKVVIEPRLSDHAMLNATNGVIPGTSWDIASNSLFTYPDVVTIDFTSAVPSPEALPAQNNPDIRQPEEYDLEEFTSNLPRLNSDRNAVSQPIIRRQKNAPAAGYVDTQITTYQGPGKPADKGDLNTVMDGLTTSSSEPVSKPVSSVTTTTTTTTTPSNDGVGSINPYPIESMKPAPSGPVMTGPEPIPLIAPE